MTSVYYDRDAMQRLAETDRRARKWKEAVTLLQAAALGWGEEIAGPQQANSFAVNLLKDATETLYQKED